MTSLLSLLSASVVTLGRRKAYARRAFEPVSRVLDARRALAFVTYKRLATSSALRVISLAAVSATTVLVTLGTVGSGGALAQQPKPKLGTNMRAVPSVGQGNTQGEPALPTFLSVSAGSSASFTAACSESPSGPVPCPDAESESWFFHSTSQSPLTYVVLPSVSTDSNVVTLTVSAPTFAQTSSYPSTFGFNSFCSICTPTTGTSSSSILVLVTAAIGPMVSYYATAAYNAGEITSAGPGGGTVACVWEVDQILARAGLAPLDPGIFNVVNVEAELKAGRGTLITNSADARPGDLVIQADQDHIGICVTDGCTTVYSNSSHAHVPPCFCDQSGINIFLTVPGRIYRLIY